MNTEPAFFVEGKGAGHVREEAGPDVLFQGEEVVGLTP
jgi:hypothetical protein